MRVIAGDGHGDDRFDPDGVLLRLAQTIASVENESDVYRAAVDGIAPIFDAQCAAIVLSPEDGSLQVAAASHDSDAYAQAVNSGRLALASDALAADAVLTGSYVIDREPFAQEQRVLIELHPDRESIRAAAAVPIVSADGTVGVFVLFSDRDTSFVSRRMESVRTFAAITAAEIHRRRRVLALLDERAEAGEMAELAKELARHTDETALLAAIAAHCRTATHATFSIAWALRGNLFEAAAIDGAGEDYARSAKFNADAGTPLGQSPEGRAARSMHIEIVKDAEADRSFAAWAEPARENRVRSILALPLRSAGDAPIVIGMYADRVDAFADATVAHLRAYAEHCRLALQTARAFAAAAAEARERSLRLSATAGITRSLDLTEVARSIARTSGEAAGARFAVTYVGDGESLSIAGAWNLPANLALPRTVNVADPSMAGYPPVLAARDRRVTVHENVATDPAWLRQGWDQQALAGGFDSVVAAPIANDKQNGSVVLFFAGPAPVGDAEAAVLMRLGAQGAAAIEAARRYARARSARDFLNRVLEESTDAIVQIDLHGLVAGWNAGAERMFGLTRDEAVGTLFVDMPFVPAGSRQDIREMFSRAGRGETVRALEIVCRNREGEPIDMLLSATPSRDEEGNIVGVVAFSKDITEQKRQVTKLVDQNRRLVTIRDITRAFGREVGVSAVTQRALDKLLDALHLDAGRVYVLDHREARLVNAAARGFTADGTLPIEVRPPASADEGLLSTSVYYRQAIVLNDVEGQKLEHPHLLEQTPAEISAMMVKPLTIGDQIVGVVQVLGFDGRRLSFDDQTLVHAVADELATSVHAAQMFEDASQAAITDPLTGLYNYRFTQDFLKKRLSEARRRRRPFAVIMADIDGLQSINERHGRAVGDEVLKQFGRILTSSVRLSDVVARYGGDEFIVLLPETQLGDALMLAERMTQAFAGYDWQRPAEDLELSASMGCAAFPDSGSHTQMLLKAADAALYQAKKSGRNAIFPRADMLPKFAG